MMPSTPACGYSLERSMMELESGTGSGRSTTEFTMAKSAVFAAMQTQNVSSTVAANPFARHNERSAYFKSSTSASIVEPQCCSPETCQSFKTGEPYLSLRMANEKAS